MKKLLILLSCLMVTSSAWGSVVFAPGILFETQKSESTQPNVSNSESDGLTIDFKLGYILPMGLYLGGMYSMFKTGDGTNDLNGNLIGPTVGYYSMMGFYTLFTYHILGEYEITNTDKLTGAKGPQIDVGWVFPLSSFFAIGPQMTYRSVEFEKIEGAATTVDTDFKMTGIEPTLSLWFMF